MNISHQREDKFVQKKEKVRKLIEEGKIPEKKFNFIVKREFQFHVSKFLAFVVFISI